MDELKTEKYSPVKIDASGFADEVEYRLEKKRKTNKKYLFYLVSISVLTGLIIGCIIYLVLDLQHVKEDECGLVFAQENLSPKVVHGIEAVPHSWPAQVVIYSSYYVSRVSISHPNTTEDTIVVNHTSGFLCAGTLINRWTVMTAAHCIIKSIDIDYKGEKFYVDVVPNEFFPTYESMIRVYLGDHSKKDISNAKLNHLIPMHYVKKIIKHPDFNELKKASDIALLILERPAELNKRVQIACLPREVSSHYPPPQSELYAIGWGTMSQDHPVSSNVLRNVILTVMNDKICERSTRFYGPTQFCVNDLTNENKSVCHGDSGGSIYKKELRDGKTKFVSVGIVSYGYKCEDIHYPGFFTRVSYHLDWIKANMKHA